MGKGDRKSKRGKIFMGSYGKSRPAKKAKVSAYKAALPSAVKADAPIADTAAAAAHAPSKKKAAPKKKATPKKKKEDTGE